MPAHRRVPRPIGARRRATGRAAVAVVIAAAAAVVVLPGVANASPNTFLVNSTGDAADAGAGRDGTCATTTNVCTLRAAIMEANAVSGHATINFALPGVTDATSAAQSIRITSKLPTVSNPAGVTMDGYSQVGSSPNSAASGSNAVLKVQIVGPGVTNTFDGLQLTGAGNIVRGLSIYQFQHSIWLEGTGSDNSSIVGNFICTDAAGVYGAQQLNGAAGGILIQDGASNNVVGTPAPADRNVISGCAHRGVIISFDGTTHNKVQNNLVGLTPSGNAALPNQAHGIDVNYGAEDTLVGGTNPFERNIVSGNIQEGIEVSHGTTNRRNDILGNCVGTDITCTRMLSYTGNGMMGIRLEGAKECDPPCGLNAGYIEVAHNVDVGNGWAAVAAGPPWGGILIDKGQQHNWVHDNLIGVLPDGTPAGNIGYGIRIEHHAMYNRIGPGNVIADNSLAGVQILSTESQPPSSTVYATTQNPVTRNSTYDNGAGTANNLGIDLPPLGVPNINGTGDLNVANAIQPPAVTGLSGTQLSGTACPGCTVEAYRADLTTLPSAPAFGEGRTFVGQAVADATSGAYTVAFSQTLVTGNIVTADQTSPGAADPADPASGAFGDTSEFTRDIRLGGPGAPTGVTAPASVGAANVSAVPVTGQGSAGAATASGTLTDKNGLSVTAGPAPVDGTTGAFTVTFDAHTLADGPLTAAVSVADGAGQQSPPVTAATVKDTTAPTPTSGAPAAGSTVARPAGVSATFDEALAPTPTVTLAVGPTTYPGTVSLSADRKTTTFTPSSPLPSGSYTETVTGTDVAGNAFSTPITFTVDADAPAPPVVTAVANPVNGTNQSAVPASGTAESGAAIHVVATDTASPVHTVATDTVATGGNWSATLNLATFVDGPVSVAVTAKDTVGNTSTTTRATTTKAANAPRLVSSVPAAGATVSSPSTVSLTFDRAFATGYTLGVVKQGGPAVAGAVASPDGRTLTFTPSAAIGTGGYTASVSGKDSASGNTVTSQITFTVDADAPSAPTLTVPTSVDSMTSRALPVSGTTTAEAGDTVTITAVNGTGTVTATTTTSSSGAYSATLDVSTLADGNLTVSAGAVDAVGNIGAVTTKTVTKGSSSTAPAFKPFTFGTNFLTASWAAPTATGGSSIDGYRLTYTPSGGTPVSVTTAATALTYTASGLPEGTAYSVTVAAHTSAGYGASAASQTVTTKFNTSATVATTPTKVSAAGGTLTLTGKVYRTSAPTTLIPGARMALYQVSSSTGAKTLIANNVTTKADGTYTYAYAPPNGSWRYQATWVGDAMNGFASSAPSAAVVVG